MLSKYVLTAPKNPGKYEETILLAAQFLWCWDFYSM